MDNFTASIAHPGEVWALVKFLMTHKEPTVGLDEEGDVAWCYTKLRQTSRSFAAVIQELHGELRDAVMIFYLVLRALDTVEDDMTVPVERRSELLDNFYVFLSDPTDARIENCGEAEEAELVQEYFRVVAVFKTLEPKYQEIIEDICMKMGAGMREFANRDVVTEDDWDLYCHYVAGLVGHGLTRMLGVSGIEDPNYSDLLDTANSMGLFLQKTNIIRDYKEDLDEDRCFWPRELWSMYAENIEDFQTPEHAADGLACLNHLITTAIELIPDCILFMEGLQDPSVFNFVCIPQVMAIATLELLYDNYDVFTGVVKIRKGTAVQILLGTQTMGDVYAWFHYFLGRLEAKVRDSDPNAERMRAAIAASRAVIDPYVDGDGFGVADGLALAAFGASGAYLLKRALSSRL